MPTTLHENRPSAGIGVVEVQKPMVFCDFYPARATLCGDRRGRGAKTHGFLRFLSCSRDPLRGSAWSRCKNPWFLRFLTCSRDPLRGSAWSRCKNPWFFAISNLLARPSAGIGVVEVQKPMVFGDFCGARATLCGNRRGRGAKTQGFLRFLSCSRDPLRGSAWSRSKNPWFFAISILLARPSAGIGAVEVQKLKVFCDFCCSNWSSGVVSWFARLLPEPAGRGFDSSLVRRRASQDATCILQQLAQSNLRRASCTEQLAQTNLHRPVCAERLA